MNDFNEYRYEDLSGVAKTILVISTIGTLWSMLNSFTHMASIGIAYGVIELIGAIGTIAACFLMLSVNIWGFYLYVGMFATAFIGVICIDLEAGIEYLFSAIGAIGSVFLVLLTKKRNGISAWKMMLANNRNKKENTSQEQTASSNSNTNDIEDNSKSSISPTGPISCELPLISTVNEISLDPSASITPPPISHVADKLNGDRVTTAQQAECKGATVSNQPKEESKYKRLLRVKLNLFLYIALGIFISFQILSICMDSSFISLGRYYWDPTIETWRIVLSSINIALAFIILFWKRGWAFVCLTIISIVSIFMVDSNALRMEWDIRDMMFNSILFLGAYLPLIITLFFKNQGVSGWRILFGMTLAIIPQTATSPRSNHVAENSPLIANEGVDKYTRLYRAISPANFVEPYSPKKVKLANELLEALIKNKDNDVVIALIEEKAKNELGIKLSE